MQRVRARHKHVRDLDKAAWARAATIACTIAAGSLEKKDKSLWTVADFTPYDEGPPASAPGLRICKANMAIVKQAFGLGK